MIGKIREMAYAAYHGKLPRNALRFQYNVSLGQPLTSENREEIQRIKTKFGLADVYVGHGTTIQRNGVAHAILGPPGIGKTRLLKNLEKAGAMAGLDDGLIVLGRTTSGQFVTITTGALATNRKKARVEQFFRGANFKSPFLGQPNTSEFKKRRQWDAIAARMAQLATLFFFRDAAPFAPQAVSLAAGVYVQHPKNPFSFHHVDESGQTRKLSPEEVSDAFGEHLQPIQSEPGWHHRAAAIIQSPA